MRILGKARWICISILAVLLTGCTNAIPDMSDEHLQMVEEYAAQLLLEYHAGYEASVLTEEEVRGAAFNYAPYEEMAAKYDPKKLTDGFNTVDALNAMLPAGASATKEFKSVPDAAGYYALADKAVEDFLAGKLNYNPDAKCDHHDHGEGHTCGEHSCGNHSCH